jgi:hypothetical protein
MEVGPLRVDGDVTSSATPDRGTDLVGRVESSALETTPFDHISQRLHRLAVFIGYGLRR